MTNPTLQEILEASIACGDRLYINEGRFCHANDELCRKCTRKVLEALQAISAAMKAAKPEKADTADDVDMGDLPHTLPGYYNKGIQEYEANLNTFLGGGNG